jgi:hypothetical protein
VQYVVVSDVGLIRIVTLSNPQRKSVQFCKGSLVSSLMGQALIAVVICRRGHLIQHGSKLSMLSVWLDVDAACFARNLWSRREKERPAKLRNLAPLTNGAPTPCTSVLRAWRSAVWFSSRMQSGILARRRTADDSAGAYTRDIGLVG